MRRTLVRTIAAAVVVIAIVVRAMLAAGTVGRRDRTRHPSTAVVTVEGLTCEVCVRRLEERISKVPGVKAATADLARQAAALTFEEGAAVSRDDITDAVQDAGFRATGVEWRKDLRRFPILAQLVMHGKLRPACAETLTRRLQREGGVRSAVVDLEKDAMTVVYDPQRTTVDHVMKALREGQNACDKNLGNPVRDESGTRS